MERIFMNKEKNGTFMKVYQKDNIHPTHTKKRADTAQTHGPLRSV